MKTVYSRLTRGSHVWCCMGAELMMDVLCAKAWMSDLELSLFNGWYDPVVRASPDLVGGCTRPFSHHAQHMLSLDSSLNPKP